MIYGDFSEAKKLTELPEEIKNALIEERNHLCETWKLNNSYHVCFVNKEGTRFFAADRISVAGLYHAFGGGSYWRVRYGSIKWGMNRGIMGTYEYSWRKSTIYTRSSNGTIIPMQVDTKKEVMDLVKNIGIFEV